MRVFDGRKWKDGFLDYHVGPNDMALEVKVWIALEPVTDQFVEWKVSGSTLSRVFTYIRAIGLKHSLIKIISRFKERNRNRKFLSLGIGQRVDGNNAKRDDELYLFLAVNHPECVNRISLSQDFCLPWKGPKNFNLEDNETLLFYRAMSWVGMDSLRAYAAWSPFSGEPLDIESLKKNLGEAALQAAQFLETEAVSRRLTRTRGPWSEKSSVTRRMESLTKDTRFSATLFGLGNYAKTVVMPALKKAVRIDWVYEIDPLQLGTAFPKKYSCDTSFQPLLDGGNAEAVEKQVYLICGYHHSHTAIASEAFRRGIPAVIEKPLATTRPDLEDFRKIALETKGKFFLCFQRRYTSFNRFIFEDLGSGPLDYRCIVHEIPLPSKHWYNWPNSGSRLISNGCHWLDHFLFLNHYAEANAFDIAEEEANYRVWVRLNNGAQFNMLLTNTGSSRVGVRDYIEVARPGATVRITDAMTLESENDHRFIRRVRASSKYENLWQMYREIGERLTRGDRGDDLKSLYSSELTLTLEEDLLRQK